MKYIFAFVFFIFSGALFFIVIDPIRGEVSMIKSEIALYEQSLESSKSLQRTQDDLINSYNNITEEDKTRLNNFLPDTVNNIRFILEIEQLANLRGMPLRNIKFEANANKADTPMTTTTMSLPEMSENSNRLYGVFPFEFTVDGNYETFLLFLKDLEHNLRLVDIKSITFDVSSVAKENNSNPAIPSTLSFTVKVETYWLK